MGISITYDKKLMTEFNIVHRKTKAKWLTWLRAAMTLLVIIMVVNNIWLLTQRVQFSTVFLLLFELALLVYVFFLDRVNGYFTGRQLLKGHNTVETVFQEDGMTTASAGIEQRIPYSQIADIYCRNQVLYMYLDKKHAHVVPESDIEGGTPEELEAFLREKCGKEIIRIK